MDNTNNLSPGSYCYFVKDLEAGHVHRLYHDTQYGFPIEDDDELFGRLILEINQAGLSWDTILKKQDNFRRAYHSFSIAKIAAYRAGDINRLLADAGIIRNKLKVNAVIYNAQQILTLQKDYGSFKNWLDVQELSNKEEWVKLFKRTFKFTGGEITGEFLMSTAYLPGAHVPDCPIYKSLNPGANS